MIKQFIRSITKSKRSKKSTISSSSSSSSTSSMREYGDTNFISFYGVVLSRLAYLQDTDFLTKYCAIMGPIISSTLLKGINAVDENNLHSFDDDEAVFEHFTGEWLEDNGKKIIHYKKMNLPYRINVLLGEQENTLKLPLVYNSQDTALTNQVKYISLGCSNYGEIFILADKRMDKTIFVLFRGTYSTKMLSMFTKPEALYPLTLSSGTIYMKSMFKVLIEMMHTIMESIRYLATNFLTSTLQDPIKIMTFGHSLGGAFATIFAYLYCTTISSKLDNLKLSKNILCISAGSPRCLGRSAADEFCTLVKNGRIYYKRIVTRGDIVCNLPLTKMFPLKSIKFEHPCHDMPTICLESCNGNLTTNTNNLNCTNKRTHHSDYIRILAHTVYLDIRLFNAVDIVNYLKGGKKSQSDVTRTSNGSTVCRIIMGVNSFPVSLKAIFFNMDDARENTTNDSDQKMSRMLESHNNSDLLLMEEVKNNQVGGGRRRKNKTKQIY